MGKLEIQILLRNAILEAFKVRNLEANVLSFVEKDKNFITSWIEKMPAHFGLHFLHPICWEISVNEFKE